MFYTYILFLFATSWCTLGKPILSIEVRYNNSYKNEPKSTMRYSVDYGDKLKDMVKMLHDTCVARSGVDESKLRR
nr:unnamed protein product [Callosobruchus chinensis]